MPILRFFTTDAHDEVHGLRILKQLQSKFRHITAVKLEACYHVETTQAIAKNSNEERRLRWLLKHPQKHEDSLRNITSLPMPEKEPQSAILIEIGPRFNFSTAFSTNCVNICQNVGLHHVVRLEASTRYLISYKGTKPDIAQLVDALSDRMTECPYEPENIPKESFIERLPKTQETWDVVPVMETDRRALEEVNKKLGLAFGDWDLSYYTHVFKNLVQRNPTTVELFDCAQSNSEHSRHWFFRGRMVVDGQEQPKSLIDMIIETQAYTNPNNTIKFSDNSSAIKGFRYRTLIPTTFEGPEKVIMKKLDADLVFTAETHNMPTAVAPFSGATTGTGGRLRDVQAVGRGGIPIAGTAGYCVGCLHIPGYPQPYEDARYQYPSTFEKPLKTLIEASNGASDYGNKFGEPLIAGFVASYGITNAGGERDEYVKPIMFSGGLGVMDANMRNKVNPQRGMLLAKIGGPVYRIGVGGGAASSVEIQGSNDSELDFNAVQRGDAEMENKVNRVVRACVEMGERNPILAIHDQGAGGNGNVLKELVEPGFAGAIIFTKEFQLGDPTITALELWAAEYQENNAILCKPEDRGLLTKICARERCPISFVGVVSGNGRVTLIESTADFDKALELCDGNLSEMGPTPFNMALEHVLGDMPKREYHLDHKPLKLTELNFEKEITVRECLNRVLSLVAVGSKRFLTNKVDRCVTGLIAQQQCVGPLHTPLSDFGLVALSHFDHTGIATSIGTQPTKGLLNAARMARMCVAEAISNLVFVKITELGDVKCSGNWMWAAKLPGEGAKLYDACKEMCNIMKELHIAVDGGKDSLSMAAKVGHETVKSPGTLVISTYAPCEDIRVKVTPDLKGPSLGKRSALLWINIESQFRLGGSALAQAYAQQGLNSPTLLQTKTLTDAFNITQNLLKKGQLLAGHDISDGGLIVSLIEMAVAGLSGINVDISNVLNELGNEAYDDAATRINKPELAMLFAEECGWILEVDDGLLKEVQNCFLTAGVPSYHIGFASGYGRNSEIKFVANGEVLLQSTVRNLFKQWEHTSFELEKLQANAQCAIEEYGTLDYRTGPKYVCNVDVVVEMQLLKSVKIIRVAVLREEGVNSDREMMASLYKANFEVHDVTMSDLLSGKTFLSNYRGVVFPGGFSYADTLGSAKGWAANIMFNDSLADQFEAFKARKDVFSLGVCNGCQLMGLIGWVGSIRSSKSTSPSRVIDVPDVAMLHNKSERFECRWSTVRIENSNAIMLQGLEGSVLGCWAAHGEGRFSFRDKSILQTLKDTKCITMHYVDDDGQPTEIYPMNPNGSTEGVAGLCSDDGRHLALMPHPERCSAMFQWPYVSPGFNVNGENSPWQLIFNNAYKWCVG